MDTAPAFPTMTGTLSLAEANAANPGVLDVLFGPDGDFPGAPRWKCLVWGAPVYTSPLTARWIDSDNVNVRDGSVRVWEQWAPMDGEWLTVPDAAIDLRVPSVAAHVAWLCARAIDPRATSGWADRGLSGWVLHWTLPEGSATAALWGFNGYSYSHGPPVPGLWTDTPAFLAALFLVLAKMGRITTPASTR